MTDKPAVAWTPTRERLMRTVAAGQIRHFHGINPHTEDTATGRRRTDEVRQLGDLVDIGTADCFDESTVRLTPEGVAWLDTYGKNGDGT